MTDGKHIGVDASLDKQNELIAKMPKDQLRSLFYLFSGKPDSRIKVYSSPVHLTHADIVELNDCISRKLKTHSIDAQITSVKVGYDGSNISEFGTWAEFQGHHWQEAECVEEVVVKWDFLVKIDSYVVPQRHTLLVRISTDIKPGKIIQLLSSGNSDEFDQFDMFSSPAFCRVDFINAQISKELINEVSEWYRGRKSPVLIPEMYYWFKKRRNGIAFIIDNWLLLSWTLVVAAFLLWTNQGLFNGQTPVHILGVSVFLAVYSLRPVAHLTHMMGSWVFKTLKELEGSRVVFEFTSGDRKKIAELKNENRKQGRKFLWNSFWAVFLNIFAAIIYTILFTKSGV